jgi:hypothetical protein
VLHTAAPKDLQGAALQATDRPDPVIDDFSHGWWDWYLLSADNPHHWEYSTRKLTAPKWQGHPGQRFTLDVQAEKANELVVVLTENFFRPDSCQMGGAEPDLSAHSKCDCGLRTNQRLDLTGTFMPIFAVAASVPH